MRFTRGLRSAVGGRALGRGRATLIAALVVAGAVVGIPQAFAGMTTTVVSKSSEVTLPPGARSSNQFATLNNASCASTSSCVAGGLYTDTNGAEQAMAVQITNGTPATAQKITLPSPYDNTSSQRANLIAVSCASTSSCVAVGFYTDTSGAEQAMAVQITNGTPGAAQKITLPSPYDSSSSQAAELDHVSCASNSSCVAGGHYVDGTGAQQGMAVQISNGTPGTAQKITLPSGYDNSSSQKVWLQSVSCASTSSCVAGGFYMETGGAYQAMAVQITGGTPATAQKITLPSGYDNSSSQAAKLTSVSCASANSCVAGGQYMDTSGAYQAMAVQITDGTPATAQKITLPSGHLTTKDQDAALFSVSCASTSSCVAAGEYYDATTGGEWMAVQIAGGTPKTAQEITVPSNAKTVSPVAGAPWVSCASTSSCVVGDEYTDTTGRVMPMVAPITDGTPAAAQEITLPSGYDTTNNQLSELTSGSCASTSSCVAAGEYVDAASGIEALTVAVQRTLAVTSSSLPHAKVGMRYHATLSAFGGIGTHTWSITSGKLPRGLSLNKSTGKISGTPKAGGTFKLTFKVSDPGPPSQTATKVIRLKVIRPLVRIPRGALRLHGHRVTVPLHCTRARCVGEVKLKLEIAGKRVTIAHHRFKIRPRHTPKLKVTLNSTGLSAVQAAGGRLRVIEVVIVRHGHNRRHHKTLRQAS